MTLSDLAELSMNSPYNEEVKARFHSAGKAYLRALADELGLEPSSYGISSNKAGIAMAGDLYLHHDRFVVFLGGVMVGIFGYARTCRGRKDYGGGPNNPIAPDMSDAALVRLCQQLLRSGA